MATDPCAEFDKALKDREAELGTIEAQFGAMREFGSSESGSTLDVAHAYLEKQSEVAEARRRLRDCNAAAAGAPTTPTAPPESSGPEPAPADGPVVLGGDPCADLAAEVARLREEVADAVFADTDRSLTKGRTAAEAAAAKRRREDAIARTKAAKKRLQDCQQLNAPEDRTFVPTDGGAVIGTGEGATEGPGVQVESVVDDLGDEYGRPRTNRGLLLAIAAIVGVAVIATGGYLFSKSGGPTGPGRAAASPVPGGSQPAQGTQPARLTVCLCGGNFGPADAAGNNPLLVRVQALPGATGTQTVVVAYTGPGLPASASFSVPAGGAATQTYTLPKCGKWTQTIQSVDGRTLSAADQASHTATETSC